MAPETGYVLGKLSTYRKIMEAHRNEQEVADHTREVGSPMNGKDNQRDIESQCSCRDNG